MTEQLIYNIYKITNTIDDKVYIGSTRLNPLRRRMDVHRTDARRNNPKALSQHMITIGIENFNIILIKQIQVTSSKVAKIQEQVELWKIPNDLRLNTIRAHIPNRHYRSNIEAKRASRRAYYHRKKEDPIWMEKERVKNKCKMRIKRAIAKNAVRD